jgi:hypothetical protein
MIYFSNLNPSAFCTKSSRAWKRSGVHNPIGMWRQWNSCSPEIVSSSRVDGSERPERRSSYAQSVGHGTYLENHESNRLKLGHEKLVQDLVAELR